MQRRCILAVILLAVALAMAAPATASTFVAMSDSQLVRQADAVVQGRVIELRSRWSDSGRLIFTDALVEVDDVIVGKANRRVVVRTPGGEVGGYTVEAIGFPKLEKGEQVLLFLTRDGEDGPSRVLGYQQGHFRIVTRLDGVTLAVPQVDDDTRLITTSGKLAPAPQSVRLDDFKAGVRTLARREGRTVAP